MTKRPSIGRSTLLLFAATGISGLLAFFRNFYVARFLLPASFGAWSLVNTLLYYANYADIGINAGMILEAPRLLGQKRPEDARRVQRQAYTATLIVCGSVALLLALTSFLPFRNFAAPLSYFRIVALAVVTLALLNYYNVVARIRDRFGLISVSVLVTAVTSTAGVVAANQIWKGLEVSQVALITVLGSTAAAVTLGLFARSSPAWPPDWRFFLRLVKIGLPVSVLPIAFTLFLSLDRWIVAALVPGAKLGYYGFGATLGMFLYMVPSTLAVVLFTRQIEHFGSTNDPKSLEPLVVPPVQLSGYVMAFAAGAAALSLPLLIHRLLPDYAPGIWSAIYQVVGNCLLFAVPVGANFLISIGRKRQLFTALAAAGLGKCALVALFVLAGRNVTSASLAVLASDALYNIAIAYLVFRYLGLAILKNVRRILASLIPFAICVPVALLMAFFSRSTDSLGNDIRLWLEFASVYTLVCGTFCLAAARRLGLLRQPFLARHLHQWLPGPLAIFLTGKERNAHD